MATAAQLAAVPTQTPVTYQRFPLPNGDGATTATVRAMMALAQGSEGSRSPIVRETALNILSAGGIANRDYAGEIAALFAWQKAHIQFRGEVAETLQSPQVTLHLGAGDCDDHVVLLAALLGSVGRQVRFITVAADPAAPSEFSHVYLEALDPSAGEWIPLDTTADGAEPGWRPSRVYRSETWPTLGDVAPYPLTPGEAFADDLATQFGTPLVNAAAQRIAYPSGTLLFGGSGQVGFNTGLPSNFPWGWVLLIAGGAFFFAKVRK